MQSFHSNYAKEAEQSIYTLENNGKVGENVWFIKD